MLWISWLTTLHVVHFIFKCMLLVWYISSRNLNSIWYISLSGNLNFTWCISSRTSNFADIISFLEYSYTFCGIYFTRFTRKVASHKLRLDFILLEEHWSWILSSSTYSDFSLLELFDWTVFTGLLICGSVENITCLHGWAWIKYSLPISLGMLKTFLSN